MADPPYSKSDATSSHNPSKQVIKPISHTRKNVVIILYSLILCIGKQFITFVIVRMVILDLYSLIEIKSYKME